jgi:hypothetical protein
MMLMILAMTVQLAVPARDPQIAVPDSALRDPYGFVLSHCSPLVRRSSESLEACEDRVGTALRTRLPDFRPRPPATTVASASDDPPLASTGTALGGRCTTRQESRRTEDRSSSSGMIVCSDDRSAAAAAGTLEGPRPPQ